MLKWFMNLTDEQIERYIAIRHDIANHTKTKITAADKVDFKYVFGIGFTMLTIWWKECNHDRTLFRLRYADEIADRIEIFGSEPNPNPAYPMALSEYMRDD